MRIPTFFAVVLGKAGKEHAADGDVDTHAQGVGPADDTQQALAGEALHEQPVAGQQPGVMDADAVAEDAFQVLPVGGVEAEVAQQAGEMALLLPAAEGQAGESLGEFRAGALREAHHVDGRPPALVQFLDGLVE
ncbi:MAG: hypothetical protein AAEJ53_00345 [Myxococcota bacterium]